MQIKPKLRVRQASVKQNRYFRSLLFRPAIFGRIFSLNLSFSIEYHPINSKLVSVYDDAALNLIRVVAI